MTGIQIKISGVWVNLADDFELEFEQTSFIFNEQGAFSYPFEIPLAANRILVKNIADPFGKIHLSDLDYADAEIWFDGIMLYRGIVRTEDNVELDDSMPFTFLSGMYDFQSKVDKMKLRDVPLDRDIKLGYVVEKASVAVNFGPQEPLVMWSFSLPGHVFMNYTETNVAEPYPLKPYCNARVCCSDGRGHYKILDAHRPYSGVCFYLMYFIDCLFKHLDIPLDKSSLDKIEDLNRVAFFNTQCHTEVRGKEFEVPLSTLQNEKFCGEEFSIRQTVDSRTDSHKLSKTVTEKDYLYYARDVYATNKNFPDVEVEEVLDDLKTAFGIRMMYDGYSGRMKAVLLRDIFRDQTVEKMDVPILGVKMTQTRAQRVRLSYGVDDDTAFNYTDYSNLAPYPDYTAILDQGVSVFETRCFLDKTTGNAYRVKVNKDTGYDPSLFEVGGFCDFVTGSESSTKEEELNINFAPVVLNDVTRHVKDINGQNNKESQILAVFADVQLLPESLINSEIHSPAIMESMIRSTWVGFPTIKARCPENYDLESESEPPLRNYDAGYTLGIMRGPGNSAAIEYTLPNYDGEGNDSFVFVESTYAFTADSCNNYGLFYDYNGTLEGGADQEGRFSLKLTAKKMNGNTPLPVGSAYESRGLVSKFLAEYLYFMANHKTVTLHVEMSVSQIINIDYSKRYRIGDYCGFINQVSYTLTVHGAVNVLIELFIL